MSDQTIRIIRALALGGVALALFVTASPPR